jgi:hypothetical protein
LRLAEAAAANGTAGVRELAHDRSAHCGAFPAPCRAVCRRTTTQGLPSQPRGLRAILSCPAAQIDEARYGKVRQRSYARADATLPSAAHWIKRNGNILLPVDRTGIAAIRF